MSKEWLFLGGAFLLVLLNGFFVATEFALVKIRPSRLKQLAEEGRPGAKVALAMQGRLDAYLSATQFGITLASLGLGWLGEPAFAALLQPVLSQLLPGGEAATANLAHTIAAVLGFAIITVLHIVVGELAPKSIAIQKAEAATLAVALPMRVYFVLFYPGIWLLDRMSRGLLRLFGLDSPQDAQEAHDADELRVILHSSAEAGSIASERAELLERALEMGEKTARQVLVPRSQVRFLDLEESLEHNIAQARASGHTWLPVCRGNMDQIEGVVNAKDLFYLLANGQLKNLSQVQRPALFVPENVTLEQLLNEFRRRRRQMALVVDEHGGTSGIVTLSDVVAEVVGDVAELGRKVPEVRTLPGGRMEVPGSTQLDDLEERLEVTFDIDKSEVTTVGGYLMAKLGKVPERGDTWTLDEFRIRVEEADGPRVLRVSVEPSAQLAAVAPAVATAPEPRERS